MKSLHQPGCTLRQRILIIFLLCAVTVTISFGMLLNYTYHKLIVQRVNMAYTANVKQFTLSFSNLINALNHISQQLACNDYIERGFEQYLDAHDSYSRIEALDNLKRNANLAVFSNPSIGMYSYSNASTGEIYLGNAMNGQTVMVPHEDNLLFRYSGASYYGFFSSQSGFSDRSVIAVTREMEINGIAILLYVETSFRMVNDLLNAYSLNNNQFLLLDNRGKVVFTLSPDRFPKDMVIGIDSSNEGVLNLNDCLLFPSRTNQGWYAVQTVGKYEYHAELGSLIMGYAVTCLALLSLFGSFFILLLHWIYRPLVIFDKAIDAMLSEDEEPVQELELLGTETGIAEYDRLISKSLDTRRQLLSTIAEVRRQERLNARMMVRRLRSQINPHFLMNTLNTVHWMASLKGESEIDDLVVALNRLLSYNLKQGSDLATLSDELAAVEQYILLQTKRYNVRYELRCQPEGADTSIPFPKFILQPLIENSLYHGYRDGMCISLTITMGDRVDITVSDDGVGMSKEALDLLKRHLSGDCSDEASPSRGMGIGMRYVVRILHMAYHGDVSFSVDSLPGVHTTITLSVPKEVKERDGCLDC